MNFVTQIKTLLVNGTLTRQQADAIAKSEGITDKTVQKELTELAIVLTAREIALQPLPLQARFSQIVALYKGQVNLSHRTSQSIMLQQYSTPAPIAFMAGEYVKHELSENYQILEPSAGNGLLTVAFPVKNVLVNEIDELRNQNLQGQGYMQVMRVDGTTDLARLYQFESLFDGIVTNPPFGTMDKPLVIGEYKINHLDHVMCIRALDCMKDNGRAAMIIGGHTNYDEKGRVQAGKNRIFLTYLYSHYNVEDIINIDGSLYSRQGTSFNVRLILINGRKAKPEGYPPLKNDDATPITDFESLYERVTGLFGDVKAEIKPKGITFIEETNNSLTYGTKNRQTVLDITNYSTDDILSELTIERKKNETALNELPKLINKLDYTPVGEQKKAIVRLINDHKTVIEIAKITIPWLEKKHKEKSIITSPERKTTRFHDVNEGDYVEIYTGITDKRKVAEGKVTFKYGKHYLKLDNDNATKYDKGYTYYVVKPTNAEPKQADWLFIGVYPTGDVYADRRFNEKPDNDYRRIAIVFHEPEKGKRVKVYNDSLPEYKTLIKELSIKYDEPQTEQKPFNLMVYGKYKDESYKAMSLAKMEQVSNLVYASLIPNTRIDEIEKYLQEASSQAPDWSFQIRVAGKGKVLRTIEPTTDKAKSEPFDIKEPDGFFYNGLIYVYDESGDFFPIGTPQKSIRNAITRSKMYQHIQNKLAIPWYKNDDKTKRLRIAKAKAKALLLLQTQNGLSGIDSKEFNKQLIQFKRGLMPKNKQLDVCITPVNLTNKGVKKGLISLPQSTIIKATESKHNILIDSLFNLPEKISEANKVFKSNTVKGAFVIVLNIVDIKLKPIVLALHFIVSENNLLIQRIDSIYGKDKRQIDKWAKKGL